MTDIVKVYKSFPDGDFGTAFSGMRTITVIHRSGTGEDTFNVMNGATMLEKVLMVTFDVTDRSVRPVLKMDWSNITDPSNAFEQSDGVTRKAHDIVNKFDEFEFAIPLGTEHPDYVWKLQEPTPGYKLHVKVRLKA